MKDYYKILGISKNATSEEIASAFRKRAKETHPDLNGGVRSSSFNDVVEAYSVLKDENSRRNYDASFSTSSSSYSQSTYSSSYSNQNQYSNYSDDSYYYSPRNYEEAAAYAEEVIRQARVQAEAAQKVATKTITKGLFWFFGTLFLSWYSYQNGYMVVMGGATISGLLMAIRGISAYIKIKHAIEEYEQNIWDQINQHFKPSSTAKNKQNDSEHANKDTKTTESKEESSNAKTDDVVKEQVNESKDIEDKKEGTPKVIKYGLIAVAIFTIIAFIVGLTPSDKMSVTDFENIIKEQYGTMYYGMGNLSISYDEEDLGDYTVFILVDKDYDNKLKIAFDGAPGPVYKELSTFENNAIELINSYRDSVNAEHPIAIIVLIDKDSSTYSFFTAGDNKCSNFK